MRAKARRARVCSRRVRHRRVRGPPRPEDRTEVTGAELRGHIDVVEESYEFFLAYAAQGLAGDGAAKAGGQMREFLRKTDDALSAFIERAGGLAHREGLEPAEVYESVLQVLERDARDTRAAVRLVMAQPSISSQLIDNLNASIHFRALLTDLFLVDEILKGT